jgi:DNA-binding IclR family transcriptional regulator
MPHAVRSVERAVQILSVLGEAGQGLALTELAVRAKLPKATAFRLLSTLANAGLVRRDDATSHYSLGPTILTLAFDLLNSMELRDAALPKMVALRDVSKETVTLSVLDGREVVYVARVESQHALRLSTSVGKRAPVHCTSHGKILLAYSDADTVNRILRTGSLERYTPRTTVDPDLIEAELAVVRAEGVAIGDREYYEDTRSAASAIFDSHQRMLAALCVHGPVHRIPLRSLPTLQKQVREAAEAISRELGWRANKSRPLPVAGSHQEYTD